MDFKTPDPSIKKKYILNKLKTVKDKKNKHYKKYKKLRHKKLALNIATNVLQTVNISSLIISLTTFPPLAIVSLSASSLNTLICGIRSVLNLDHKMQSHFTSYQQLKDCYNKYSLEMLKKNNNLDQMLDNLTSELAIIDDAELPTSKTNSDTS